MDFRGRPFDFWGGYRWFQKKKMSCRLISGGKKHANKFLGKNILHWKKYRSWRIMLKKNLTPLYVGEKISNSREVWKNSSPLQTKSVKSPIPHSSTNDVQWSSQPFRGWGKKPIWHLSKCHPSTKWLAGVHHEVVIKSKVLHFKIEKTLRKDTNGKRKFKRMLSFLFMGKRKLFAMKLSFERNSTLFSTRRIGALGLFWTNQGSEVSEETWGTFRTLWSKKSAFLKGKFCIYKGFMDVFYILTSAWKKNHKICIWNCFFAMYSTDLTCVNATI